MTNYIFDGCDTVKLAEKYGTPLYVISESHIIERIDEIKRDFLDKYPNTKAVYACKALQTVGICKLIDKEGLGFDVVSGGELYTAIRAGVSPSKIVFHGNNKTYDECKMAIDCGVGTIVCDSISELIMLNDLAGEMNKRVEILFRITPGVNSHTHEYISTGHHESKFGISPKILLEGRLLESALSMQNVLLKGFHFHVGSQLTDNSSHIFAVKKLLEFIKEVINITGFIPSELNLGGGYGIQYRDDPPRKPLSYYTDPMMEEIITFCNNENIKLPTVTIEPGRFIVGEAGITLYQVGTIKTTLGGRTFVSVDGGFPDNPRTALYHAKYDAIAIEKMGEPNQSLVTIAGKCCESGDILVWDIPMPELKRGDYIALLSTGAYNYSMSSNYNRIPRPALVMVKEGKDRLSLRRETYEDLISKEIF
ncbi:MAG: diaminopimelate decarboxylase [Clostridiales bacterium]|nr:diaminopimelate decarboxylase [Clostridiales bacterium]